ncbi:hypothetical protein BKA70DRAFT_1277762 [Coprinopsis sp. MPI-PUGE-AT-0042]|nr:hypothetical protein BKA70DRAFT_1277762 [Coprinopsis sp. MPI-PUGE-AT-0042]
MPRGTTIAQVRAALNVETDGQLDHLKNTCKDAVLQHFSLSLTASEQPDNVEKALQMVSRRNPILDIDVNDDAHRKPLRYWLLGFHDNRRRAMKPSSAEKRDTPVKHNSSTIIAQAGSQYQQKKKKNESIVSKPAPFASQKRLKRSPSGMEETSCKGHPVVHLTAAREGNTAINNTNDAQVTAESPVFGDFRAMIEGLLPSFGWLAQELQEFGFKTREKILAIARRPDSSIERVVGKFCDDFAERNRGTDRALTGLDKILLQEELQSLKRIAG